MDQDPVVVEVAALREDGDTQTRIQLSGDLIQEYALLMEDGVEFPPITVWKDSNDYWLVDGFHRVAACRQVGRGAISANVSTGTLLDAQWASYRSNSDQGARRTRADMQLVVKKAILHPQSAKLSNNQIARYLGVPESTLRRWRKDEELSSPDGEDIRIVSRGTTSYQMRVRGIGQRRGATCRTCRAKTLRELERQMVTCLEKFIHS